MAEINVRGVIVSNNDKWIYEWFDMEATSPKDVINQLNQAKGEEITVVINSGGGDVYAGSDIYTALKEYRGNVTIKIVGVAASAASVIAMAGKKVVMSPTAQLMIHNVWTMVQGDYRTLEHEAEVLKGHNAGIANAYMLKTGMQQKELLDLMDKESYFNAQQALQYKFVDEIMFDDQNKLVASVKTNFILPPEILNKMRSHLAGNKPPASDDIEAQKAQSRLNLLKLKGGIKNEIC